MPAALVKEASPEKRAQALEKALSDLGSAEEFTADDLLKVFLLSFFFPSCTKGVVQGKVKQPDILLAIYDTCGAESMNELYAGMPIIHAVKFSG